MIETICINKHRNKQNIIDKYLIKDTNGVVKEFSARDLKEAIKKKEINVVNLKMTSDGKLIDNHNVEKAIISENDLLLKMFEFTAFLLNAIPTEFKNVAEGIFTFRKFFKKTTEETGIEVNKTLKLPYNAYYTTKSGVVKLLVDSTEDYAVDVLANNYHEACRNMKNSGDQVDYLTFSLLNLNEQDYLYIIGNSSDNSISVVCSEGLIYKCVYGIQEDLPELLEFKTVEEGMNYFKRLHTDTSKINNTDVVAQYFDIWNYKKMSLAYGDVLSQLYPSYEKYEYRLTDYRKNSRGRILQDKDAYKQVGMEKNSVRITFMEGYYGSYPKIEQTGVLSYFNCYADNNYNERYLTYILVPTFLSDSYVTDLQGNLRFDKLF